MTEWEEIHRRNLRKGLRELEEEGPEFGYDEYGREYTYEDALSAYADDLYLEHKENV